MPGGMVKVDLATSSLHFRWPSAFSACLMRNRGFVERLLFGIKAAETETWSPLSSSPSICKCPLKSARPVLLKATMKVFIILAVLVASAVAQYEENYAPIPYSFNYNANTEDGGNSGHQESGDGNGRVQGSYTVTDLEGHTRVVDYVADENGFRASIRTNEPGTANLNPADVTVESSADDNGIAAAYSGAAAPAAPVAAVAPGQQAGVRYVLVPVNDPRARGYY